MSKMILKAKYNAIIVKEKEKEEIMSGNIIVPDLGKESNKIGVVVDVGPGQYSATGILIPTQYKVGDMVVLPSMGFTKVEVDGEEYLVGIENQVLAVIEYTN